MPPKKIIAKTSNIAVPVKLSRGRLKKEKTILKTPSIVKVKIPSKKDTDHVTVDSVNEVKLKAQDVEIRKPTRTMHRKIVKPNKDLFFSLSNEVAKAQLTKKPKKLNNNVSTSNENKGFKKNPILKIARKKSIKNNITDKADKEVNIATSQKRIVRKVKSEVYTEEESCVTSSDTVEAEINVTPAKNKTEKIPKLKKSKKLAEKMSLSQSKCIDDCVTQELIPVHQEPKTVTKRKLTLNRKYPVRPGPKSKRKNNECLEAAPNKEAPLLSDKTHGKIGKEISNADENNPIDFRRSSMTSMSELSWTKDISSCSTTTCVTVSSNDFIRIGKKMPVLKLTNIKSTINKGHNQKTFNSDLVPTDDTVKNSLQEKDDISLTPSSITSLKLSSISSKSTTPKNNNMNRSSQDAKCKIKNLLDKLSSNLKKIDLEVVSWIGYTNEYSSNVDSLKTKLLKHNILCEEREALLQFRKTRLLSLKYQENNSPKQVYDKIRPASVVDYPISEKSNSQPNDKLNKLVLDPPDDSFGQPKQGVNRPDDELNKPVDQINQCNVKINLRNDQLEQPKDQFNEFDEKAIKDTGQSTDELENTKEVEQNSHHTDKETKEFDNFRSSFNKFSEDNDDDDALSLYAESITGIESSRRNSTVPGNSESQDMEEYVPQYVSSDPFKLPAPTVYQPSKINQVNQEELSKKKIPNVCEKQNADSTSINREFACDIISQENVLISADSVKNVTDTVKIGSIKNCGENPPCLMASIFKPVHGVKSSVFKGVCFFNMIFSCKKMECHFPHVSLDIEDVQKRLSKLNEELFIQEYLLIRTWPKLRREYGLCYVEECIKRDNPRILVEMSIDFIIKANSNYSDDSVLQLAVAEYTLLYLNKVDLNICADLLNYNVNPAKSILLCDFFMTTIAETPNFSRFKTVFVKLTKFMCYNGRTFSLDVATQFLERICILPYDELLAWAQIEIIKRTEVSIFSNTMMKDFEKQLSICNPTLHEEFLSIKCQVTLSPTVLENYRLLSPQLNHDIDRTNSSMSHSEQDIRYSPDTTNFDNLNKPVIEPKFTRTVNLNKIQLHINKPSKSVTECHEAPGRSTKTPFSNWKGMSILSRVRAPYMHDMRPPSRLPFKRRLDIPYGGSPAKYQRNGPRFF